MKRQPTLPIAFALSGCALLAACWANAHNQNTSVAIHDTAQRYELEATYEKQSSDAVFRYLDSCFAPEKILSHNSETDRTVSLTDNTTFDIQASSNHVHILMDKRKNTPSSVARIRRICTYLPFAVPAK